MLVERNCETGGRNGEEMLKKNYWELGEGKLVNVSSSQISCRRLTIFTIDFGSSLSFIF